jgi:hypothetical protein
VIALKLKLFKSLPSLSGSLFAQKASVIKQYQLEMDNYLSNAFSQWFDRGKYIKLKEKIAAFKKTYYTNQSLNCSTIIATSDDTGAALLSQDISWMVANLNS